MRDLDGLGDLTDEAPILQNLLRKWPGSIAMAVEPLQQLDRGRALEKSESPFCSCQATPHQPLATKRKWEGKDKPEPESENPSEDEPGQAPPGDEETQFIEAIPASGVPISPDEKPGDIIS